MKVTFNRRRGVYIKITVVDFCLKRFIHRTSHLRYSIFQEIMFYLRIRKWHIVPAQIHTFRFKQ